MKLALPDRAGRPLSAFTSGARPPRFVAIWVATGLLFTVSPLLAAGSMSSSALLSMLPFAAILAIASIGQTLVIQQRGLDLSVPGMMSLSAVIVTLHCDGVDDRMLGALVLVLLASLSAGLLNGIAVGCFGITPLIATLGVNAPSLGAIQQVTNGNPPPAAPPGLASFALDKTAGLPNAVIVAAVSVVLVAALVGTTIAGRRLIAVGANAAAARVAGIAVRRYRVGAYVIAAISSGAAGVLLAAYLNLPGLTAGNDYLFTTIAAVVLGGTSLAGGSGSVVATAVGALFLTQLQQVVAGMGAPPSAQLIIQGSIIAVGMGLRVVPWRSWLHADGDVVPKSRARRPQ